ncbi:hypothetical protein KUTeg_018164 [Tegillarca granosa]|uniref:SOCS box domain-containing protein n=1 Tax=Tegillarca granosa TaxID=220873 RepID=A0ABQ9EH44_TEGGR|nr:hypothetical protein KUTeg_018164 [Tegillarca granosa]
MANKNSERDFILLQHVKTGKYDLVKSMLLSGKYNREFRDDNDRTALHWAAEYGYYNITCALNECKWDVNATDYKNQVPLIIACNYKHADIASYLIAVGCDVNIKDATGNTPLHRAIRANLENTVCMLLGAGADIHIKNESHWTPLHEAVRMGNEYIVRRLLKLGANVNATIPDSNGTPFATAVFYFKISKTNHYKNLDSIGKMLIENGCYLSYYDRQWTPLLSSISICNSYLASLLLFHGCLLECPKSYSRSLFVDAFTCCDAIVVKLLIICGYRITLEEIELCARIIPTYSSAPFAGLDLGTNGVQTIQWLKKHILKVPLLSEVCRVSIRKSLNYGSNDTSIIKNIDKLVLPSKLKQYIRLDELGSICSEPI